MATVREDYRQAQSFSRPATLQSPNKLFSKLKGDMDLAVFLAIVQCIPDCRILPLVPILRAQNSRAGASGLVYMPTKAGGNGVAFKRVHSTSSVSDMYEALACELLVLEHPVIRRHPNVVQLHGIAFDVHTHGERVIRVLPCLAMEHSRHGNLEDFVGGMKSLSVLQRLKLCLDVATAIEALHGLNIIHGDIKPQNILVFDDQDRHVAKVTDFGTSCFHSDDDQLVELSYTEAWKAPEVRADNTVFTLRLARKTDVYSFGKLCDWLLSRSDKDQTSGELSDAAKFSPSKLKSLMGLLAKSRDEDPTVRPDIYKLRKCLSMTVEEYRKQDLVQHAPLSLPQRIRPLLLALGNFILYSLSWLVTRARASRKATQLAEFHAPGQIRLAFIIPNLSWAPALVTSLLLLVWPALAAVMAVFTKRRPADSPVPKGALIAIPIFLVAGFLGTAALLRFISLSTLKTPFGWADVNVLFTWYRIFGYKDHAVPDICIMFPVLNRFHFCVREELLVCLKRIADQSDCTECQRQASIQLSLAHRIGFGTRRDVIASDQALKRIEAITKLQKNKKNVETLVRNVENLCKTLNYYDFAYATRMGIIPSTDMEGYTGEFSSDPSLQYPPELHQRAVARYQEEIRGKKESGVGLYSLLELQETLAKLFQHQNDYKRAEDSYRDLSLWMQKVDGLNFVPQAFSRPLQYQGKYEEAIHVLNTVPDIRCNPNGRTPRVLPEPIMRRRTGRIKISARQALVWLLITTRQTDELLNLDLLGDLVDLTTLQVDSTILRRTFYHVNSLAELLVSSGRFDEAADLTARRLQFAQDHFKQHREKSGEFVVNITRAEHSFILSYCRPADALAIQNELLEEKQLNGFEFMSWTWESKRTIRLRMSQICNLAKTQKFGEAMTLLEVLFKDQHEMTEKYRHGLGCMFDLVDCLFVYNYGESKRIAQIQSELLALCGSMPDGNMRVKMIVALCEFLTVGGRESVVQELREILNILESSAPRSLIVLKIQGILLFILSSWGIEYENRKLVDDACDIGNRMLDFLGTGFLPEDNRFPDRDKDILTAYQFIAYASYNRLLICNLDGFRSSDRCHLDEAVETHRLVANQSQQLYGERHVETVYDSERMAMALAYHGRILNDESSLVEARQLLNDVLAWKQATQQLFHRITPAITKAQLLTFPFQPSRERNWYYTWKSTAEGYVDSDWDKRKVWKEAISDRGSEILAAHPAVLALDTHFPPWEDTSEEMPDFYRKGLEMTVKNFIEACSYLSHDQYFPAILRVQKVLAGEGSPTQDIRYWRKAAHLASSALVYGLNGTTLSTAIKYKSLLAKALAAHRRSRPEGIQLAREVLESEEKLFGENCTRTIASKRRLAEMLLAQADEGNAVEGEEFGDDNEPSEAQPLLGIATDQQKGQRENLLHEAQRLLVTALGVAAHLLGADHPTTIRIWNCMRKPTLEQDETRQLLVSLGVDLEHPEFKHLHAIAQKCHLAKQFLGNYHPFSKAAGEEFQREVEKRTNFIATQSAPSIS